MTTMYKQCSCSSDSDSQSSISLPDLNDLNEINEIDSSSSSPSMILNSAIIEQRSLISISPSTLPKVNHR